jgi:WD40 repeat protein
LSEVETAPDRAKLETLDTTSSTTPEVHDESKQGTAAALQETPISFAKQSLGSSQATKPKAAGLSSLLSAAPPQARPQPLPPRPKIVSVQQPSKVNKTKHAGQQSLRVRSDGRIFATGGWDSRVRIYSSKTLKEVAVLKWHKEGVYAVDFAQVLEAQDLQNKDEQGSQAVLREETGLGKLQRQREEQMQLKHWVVAGAKDGKISLWEIF